MCTKARPRDMLLYCPKRHRWRPEVGLQTPLNQRFNGATLADKLRGIIKRRTNRGLATQIKHCVPRSVAKCNAKSFCAVVYNNYIYRFVKNAGYPDILKYLESHHFSRTRIRDRWQPVDVYQNCTGLGFGHFLSLSSSFHPR